MRKLGVLLLTLMAVTLTFTACQKESGVVQPLPLSASRLSAAFELPEGATLQSATFSIFVLDPSSETVNVHRITQPWDEMTVTWNNFGGNYDAAVASTFVPSAIGWHSVDVTALVQGWLDGTYPDYGFLLEQSNVTFTSYASSEHISPSIWPKLEVCYTTADGTNCITLQRGAEHTVYDTYIWQFSPDHNGGGADVLYTGFVGGGMKMSLLWFDIAVAPQPEGCTLTIGYWKNHGGFGPQPDYVSQYLPIWLGTPGGGQSFNVNTGQIAHDILVMKTYGVPSNGITKLYAQLLAAKLNIANGADGRKIAATITAADAWLANHSWTEWSSLSKNGQKQVLSWMSKADQYNNGLIGPGHCDVMGNGII